MDSTIIPWNNISTFLVLTLVFVFFFTCLHGYLQPKNLPPGPKGWPVLGFIPQGVQMARKGMNLNELLAWFGEKYGPVSSFSVLGQRMVVINGYHAVRKVFNMCDMNARNAHGDVKAQVGVKPRYQTGILLSSGDLWKEVRKFSLATLRGFGIGKRRFEEQIAAEAKHLLQQFGSTGGSLFDPSQDLHHSTANVICSVVLGKRFEYSDPKFKHLVRLIADKTLHPIWTLIGVTFPVLGRLPFGPPRRKLDEFTAIREVIRQIVEEHVATLDPMNERDFIDVYLNEIRSEKQQDDLMAKVFADNILAVIDDLFAAGSETTSTTLRWGLLFMVKYPNVQTRVQKEIDSMVGRNRLPKLSDKADLPYTEAVLHEIQRVGSIVYMALPRYVKQTTEFEGFVLPKGALVLPDLYSAMRDPSIWKDPEDFKPERFLDDHGCVQKPQELIVFGSGRRMCLGEQLARMELFIIFTHLMHRFSLRTETKLNLKPKAEGVMSPYPYELRAIERD